MESLISLIVFATISFATIINDSKSFVKSVTPDQMETSFKVFSSHKELSMIQEQLNKVNNIIK